VRSATAEFTSKWSLRKAEQQKPESRRKALFVLIDVIVFDLCDCLPPHLSHINTREVSLTKGYYKTKKKKNKNKKQNDKGGLRLGGDVGAAAHIKTQRGREREMTS
jgi:hypothetical protein